MPFVGMGSCVCLVIALLKVVVGMSVAAVALLHWYGFIVYVCNTFECVWVILCFKDLDGRQACLYLDFGLCLHGCLRWRLLDGVFVIVVFGFTLWFFLVGCCSIVVLIVWFIVVYVRFVFAFVCFFTGEIVRMIFCFLFDLLVL